MARSYASTVLDAPADVVWARIRDFGGLTSWHAEIGLATCELEEGKESDQVGCVRHFVFPDGTVVRERLLHLSDAERTYSYTFVETPFAVTSHRAIVRSFQPREEE